ncbi:hypothetical protein CHM34_07125 [Paludifilum halophilum]|uniref:Hydrolase n=2 Tax=Paludifilum halophilum TaxID=1642702 RepID=A0A235B8H6_9BACL|nr:hypothetical protein CHM34_07125 [Paludifilum halophilum]
MGEILQEKGTSPYGFQIEATDEEVRKLNRLLANNSTEDMETFWDAHTPFLQYNQNRENDGYDRTMQQIYRQIYRLGTPETRHQMEELGLINP